MSLFAISDGTFAGQTIRVTPDHYASIYDVIRVAAGVKNPHDTWSTVQTRVSEMPRPSESSARPTSALGTPPRSGQRDTNESPMIKTYKFPGRGQQDTPVINGRGLIKLLFHLPGPKARQFVAESSETLVRYLGGDESLIEEIRANHQTANADPASLQRFMASNINASTTSSEATIAGSRRETLELDELEARVAQRRIENDIRKLNMIEQYREFAMKHLPDPRLQEHITNLIANQVQGTLGGTQQFSAATTQQPFAQSSQVTVDQVCSEIMQLYPSTPEKALIGQKVASVYRKKFPGVEISKVPKYVNGENRPVNIFPRHFASDIETCVRQVLNAPKKVMFVEEEAGADSDDMDDENDFVANSQDWK